MSTSKSNEYEGSMASLLIENRRLMQAYGEMKKENDSLKFKLLKIETILQEAKCRQDAVDNI